MEILYAPIEDGLDSLGLMRGPWARSMRFFFFASVTGAALQFTKPKLMFDDKGMPKKWMYDMQEEDDYDQIPTTPIPWWLASFIVGAAGCILI